MAFLLNTENVAAYLSDAGLLERAPVSQSLLTPPLLTPKHGKNFNLRVRAGDRDWLVKQESHGLEGESAGELQREWAFFQLLNHFDELEEVRSQVIQPVHFDATNSIIVFPYCPQAKDLSDVYDDARNLARHEIAAQLGDFFARLHNSAHRSTFDYASCKVFTAQLFDRPVEELAAQTRPDFLLGLRRLTPESFCVIPTEALKFFRFYQRYPQMGVAIEQLSQTFDPCCLTHSDPRFANFLLHDVSGLVQPIDWEKWRWSDPAYDLAKLVANYLKLWLKSLPISAELELATVLNMASVPLSAVQPNVAALVKAYFACFPEILSHCPNFTIRLVQFTGLSLLRQVQLYIAHKQPIGNVEMAMSQVAKTLLCQPEMAVSTVFGCKREELEEDDATERDFGARPTRRELSPDDSGANRADARRSAPLAAGR